MKKAVTIVILLLSIALIIGGVLLGQSQPVLTKASKVCLECIGIG